MWIGNQHGGRKYDDLQNLPDMKSHEKPLFSFILACSSLLLLLLSSEQGSAFQRKQLSAAYLPWLCTNESRVWSPVPILVCTYLSWFPFQTCFHRFFSGYSGTGFRPASINGSSRSNILPEVPPGKLSEATLSKYGLYIVFIYLSFPFTCIRRQLPLQWASRPSSFETHKLLQIHAWVFQSFQLTW